jgi:hypothetical protein
VHVVKGIEEISAKKVKKKQKRLLNEFGIMFYLRAGVIMQRSAKGEWQGKWMVLR